MEGPAGEEKHADALMFCLERSRGKVDYVCAFHWR